MKKNKFLLIIVIVAIIGIYFCLVASTPATISGYKVVLPNTNLYKNASFNSEVIAIMPQNAYVDIVDEPFMENDKSWQKIIYNSYEGYVLSNDIFYCKEKKELTFKHARAKSSKLGQPINLYVSNSLDSEIKYSVNDGEQVELLIDDVDYGNFEMIDYMGGKYFVEKENVTTSLSSNQTLALILIIVTAVITAVALTIYLVLRKKRLQTKKNVVKLYKICCKSKIKML